MTLHVYDDLEQRSEAWFAVRRGIVTASAVGKLITSATPDPGTVDCGTCSAMASEPCLSMAAKKTPTAIKTYHPERIAFAASLRPELTVADNDTSAAITATLAAERVSGFVEETPTSSDMFRGIYSEPFARDVYSSHYHQAVECGFMTLEHDGWRLGYSPDGLVADDGLIEIKAPRSKTHLRTILNNAVPDHYMAQCQTGLLVSGRRWLDFVSYVGGMPLYVCRVEPSPLWFDAITAAVAQAETAINELVTAYNTSAAGLPPTERIDPYNEVELKLA